MKALCKKRNNVAIQNVELFVDELKEFLDHHAFPPCAIINYDETRISFDQKNLKVTRIESRDKSKSNLLQDRENTLASLLTFVCADGAVVMSAYVMKGKFDNDQTDVQFVLENVEGSTTRSHNSSWDRFFVFIESGFINSDTFENIMKKFIEVWRKKNP